MSNLSVYNVQKIKVYIGGTEIHGFADSSKVKITAGGEGTNKTVGCDGEVVFSVDVDNTFEVELSLLQSSSSNDYLSNCYKNFRENGVTQRIMIKDLMGSTVFSSRSCTPKKYAEADFQKTSQNRVWTIMTGQADTILIGGANNESSSTLTDLTGQKINTNSVIMY